jgi:diguanylate cyclase (GGDEF)-like protein
MSELKYIGLIVVWIGAWHLAGVMEYAPYTSLWYLPAGLSMAAFIVLGKRALLPIFIAASLIDPELQDALSGNYDTTDLFTGMLFGLVHTSAYAIGGSFARYYFIRLGNGEFPRKTITLLVAFAISSGLAAIGGISVLVFTGGPMLYDALEGIITWWLGDLIGCLVVTPLAMGLFFRVWPQFSPPIHSFVNVEHPPQSDFLRFISKVLVVCLFAASVMVSDALLAISETPYFMFFLGVPLIWIIYTEHPYHAALTLLLISVLMVIGLLLLDLHNHAVIYQFALCMTAINAYLAMSVPRLMQQNLLLSEITMTDILTGLASQARLISLANKMLQQPHRQGQHHSLMRITIDNIHAINDSYGRAIGDQVIIATAKAIRGVIPPGSMLARADSEAYLLLLPNTNESTAKALIPLLKRCLPEIAHKGFVVPLRSSFSVVTVDSSVAFDQALTQTLSSIHHNP